MHGGALHVSCTQYLIDVSWSLKYSRPASVAKKSDSIIMPIPARITAHVWMLLVHAAVQQCSSPRWRGGVERMHTAAHDAVAVPPTQGRLHP